MDENRFDDLKEAYALGALSDSERREMKAYLADNPERQAEVDDLAAAANLLALSAEEHEPPATLRRNVMSTVAAEAASPPRTTGVPETVFTRLRRAFSFPRLASGVAVITVVAGLLLWNSSLQNQVQDLQGRLQQPNTYELQASGAAKGTSAEMVEVHKGQIIMVAKNLPPVPEGKAYQMWAIEDGKPRPGSVFEPGEKTTTAPLGTDFEGADVLAVTVEPAEGSTQPTTAPVLTAKI